MKNKAKGPSDRLVTEMLQKLPMESVYEIIHWFQRKIQRRVSGSSGAEHSTSRIPQDA